MWGKKDRFGQKQYAIPSKYGVKSIDLDKNSCFFEKDYLSLRPNRNTNKVRIWTD